MASKTINERFRDMESITTGVSSLRVVGNLSLTGTTTQLTTTQDLSTGALDYTTVVGSNFIVKGIYFSFDSATTQDISLEYLESITFVETATSALSAKIDGDLTIFAGEGSELTIKCTNNGTPAVTVTVTLDVEVS